MNPMTMKPYDVNEMQFVTLTYNPQSLPYQRNVIYHRAEGEVEIKHVPTLEKHDVQCFLKRLRKSLDYPIRYYFVGEYGTRTERPHYHAIIYGLKTKDNHLVKECWPHGFVCVRPFFKETTVYVAGYIQKKLFGKHVYSDKLPPFTMCSQKLGLAFILQPDVLANIKADPDHCLYINGYKRGLPRYFRKKLIEMGEIESQSYDELCDKLQTESLDFADLLISQDLQYRDWYNNYVAVCKHKFVKNNRKRNSNTEV